MNAAPTERAAPAEAARYLLVRAGEHVCALPLASVRRVVRALNVRRLPGAAEELRGLAEFAGEPLPVLDLGRLVDAAPGATPEYPVTIVAWAGPAEAREVVGLSADAALEVVEIPAAEIVGGSGGLVAGEAEVGGEAVRVLDPALLGSTE